MPESRLALLRTRSNPWYIHEDRDEGSLWLAWLVRLRWVAIVAQTVTLSFTFGVIHNATVVVPALLVAVAFLVACNFVSTRHLNQRLEASQELLLSQLMIDVTVLSAFFVATGGPENPFVMLYVIHVAMAAVMLRPRYALVLAITVVALNMGLHVWHLPLHPEQHRIPADTLMAFGQTAALTITVSSVAAFVMGMSSTLRRQRNRLLQARDRAARTDRLRAVGTLAAGAAHELNTPLSTMGLRLRRIGRRHKDQDTTRDTDVIQSQLARCTAIVEQLLVGAGDPSAANLERAPLSDFVAHAIRLWSKSATIDANVAFAEQEPILVELPRVAFTQAFINLLENARQAQEEVDNFDPLTVHIHQRPSGGEIVLYDAGPGLPKQAERVGEPFFTTKSNGTGLGVFVARAVAEGAGGGLAYDRENGRTLTRWWFRSTGRAT